MPKPKIWDKKKKWAGRKPGSYEWYEIQDSIDYYKEFEKEKIILPDISKEGNFTFDIHNYYSVNTSYIIPTDEKWLLSILNSKLITWYYTQIDPVFRGGYLRWIFQYIEKLPVATYNQNNPEEKSKHDQIVTLVDQMLDLNKRLPDIQAPQERTAIERQIKATDKQIDRPVYELYDLTEDEIRIVEGV